MVVKRFLRVAVAGAMILIGASAANAQRDRYALTALNAVEPGQWVFREGGREVSKLCVTNVTVLLQTQHPGVACNQVVLENNKDSAAVHYTCAGHGYGRTSLSVETPKLVLINTAGVRDGAPFSTELEGRKVGTCG